MIKKNLNFKIGLSFGVSFLVLLIITLITTKNIETLTSTNQKIENIYKKIFLLESLLSNLNGIESGIRGYTISQDPKFVANFENSKKLFINKLNETDSMLSFNPQQAQNIQTLKILSNERLSHISNIFDLGSRNNFKAAIDSILSGKGLVLTNDIRTVIYNMEQIERNILEQEFLTQEKNNRTIYFVIISGNILTFIFLIIYFLIIRSDLKQRIKIEEQLRNNEKLKKTIISNFPNGTITLYDKNLKILLIDGLELKKFGFTSIDFIGKSLPEIFPEEKEVRELKKYYESTLKGFTNEFEFTYRENSYKVTSLPIKDDEGDIVGGLLISQNITESKKTIEKLTKSELSLNYAQRVARVGSWEWDIKENIVTWSDEMYKIFGLKPRSINITYERFIERVHPDDREMINKIIANSLQNFASFRFEHRIILPNGEVRMNLGEGEVIVDENNNPVKMIGIGYDITERKKAEKEIKELNQTLEKKVIERTEELQMANKELEAFSYTVSHDLRTPLRAIDGFVKIILEDYSDKLDEEGKKYLNIITQNTTKMRLLIDDLLNFSKISKIGITKSEIDMNNLVQNVISDLVFSFNKNECSNKYKEMFKVNNLLNAKGDYSILKQVWINLISNAIKFTRTKETPRIIIDSYSQNGSNIYYIKDNGVGFNMKYKDKLFTIFQRLHSQNEFEGTGIGLAIVQRVIKRHNGNVWAESIENEETTFYFSLPNSD